MRKSVFLTLIVLTLIFVNAISFATEDAVTKELEASEVAEEVVAEENDEPKEEQLDTSEVSGASEEILETMSRKDERIKLLTQKYNDPTLGKVAYGLEVVRFYSTPVLFIFLVMGAFNFFIVGNKKLDKKEQGFGWITTCLVGWVVFQCIPLIFALVTVGINK